MLTVEELPHRLLTYTYARGVYEELGCKMGKDSQQAEFDFSKSAPKVSSMWWPLPKRGASKEPTAAEYVEILRVVNKIREPHLNAGINHPVEMQTVMRALIGAAYSEAIYARVCHVLDKEGIPRRRRQSSPKLLALPSPAPAAMGAEVRPVSVLPVQTPAAAPKPAAVSAKEKRSVELLERLTRKALSGDDVAAAVLERILAEDEKVKS